MTTTIPPRSYTRLAGAIVIAAVVIGAGIIASSYLGTATTVTRSITSTRTVVTTQTNPFLGYCYSDQNHSNPLNPFNVQIYYGGQWNATVKGYASGAAVPTFTACFEGNGNGVISIGNWAQNQTSYALTLSATIQKGDGSDANLTAIFGGTRPSTTTPYGSVTVSGGIFS
jgi:hypothetical protein